MPASIGDVMRHCRNYFEYGYKESDFSIVAGALSPRDLLTEGQYIAISGSLLNDGVWKLESGFVLEGAQDEEFFGRIWLLRPPRDFIALCESISDYNEKTPVSAIASESFGNYSRTMARGATGVVLGWQAAFANAFTPYRRMFTEVGV